MEQLPLLLLSVFFFPKIRHAVPTPTSIFLLRSAVTTTTSIEKNVLSEHNRKDEEEV